MRSLLKLSAIASVLALSFACGDDDGGTGGAVDAGPDIDVDAMDPVPTSGPCSIFIGDTAISGPDIVFGEEPSKPTLSVVFNGPDGALLGTAVTDDKGLATFDACVGDTMITAIVQWPVVRGGLSNPAFVYTYAGVQPGDTAYLGQDFGEPMAPLFANVNVSGDADLSAFEGPYRMEVNIGCDDNDVDINDGVIDGPVSFMNISPYCLGSDNTIDVIATLRDEGEQGYAFLKDVSITPGTMGAVAENLVNLPAWIPGRLPTNALVVGNLPVGESSGFYFMEQWVDGVAFAGTGSGYETDSVSLSSEFQGLPEEFGEQTFAQATLDFGCCGGLPVNGLVGIPVRIGFGSFTQLIRLQDFVHTAQLDMGTVLPEITDVIVTRPDDARPVLNWIVDGSLDGANIGVASVRVYEAFGPFLGNWTVVTPNVATGSFKVPVMPTELGDYGPMSRGHRGIPNNVSRRTGNWLGINSSTVTPMPLCRLFASC